MNNVYYFVPYSMEILHLIKIKEDLAKYRFGDLREIFIKEK